MLKTYLYIPEQLEEKIKYTAKAQKRSKADVIRQALEKGIFAVQQQGTASVQVLLKIAELGRKYKVKGPKDAVERFDEYLYGKDWSK
jgi:predicted DNA-binding protein